MHKLNHIAVLQHNMSLGGKFISSDFPKLRAQFAAAWNRVDAEKQLNKLTGLLAWA
jgi:hypothetical protein